MARQKKIFFGPLLKKFAHHWTTECQTAGVWCEFFCPFVLRPNTGRSRFAAATCVCDCVFNGIVLVIRQWHQYEPCCCDNCSCAQRNGNARHLVHTQKRSVAYFAAIILLQTTGNAMALFVYRIL